MANEVVNSGARASADTTNIDDVISYLESPEYLRMIARAQGESPDSLLSGSRTQPWEGAPPAPAPDPLSPLRLHLGGAARITSDYPWSAPLHPGDRVTLISEEFETTDDPDPIKWFRVRDETGNEWSVPSEDMEPITTGLADWEREILETPHPVYDVTPTPEPGPEDEPEFNEPTPQGATANTFGVRWGSNGRCTCGSCLRRRMRVTTPAPAPRAPSPVQMRTRDGWWEFRDTLASRTPFNTHGALRGRVRPESSESGYLRDKSPAAAQLWQADQSKIDYVVYSYNTPIAWQVTGTTFSEWIYPDVRYSRTTSAHQSKIKTALLNTPGGDFTRMIREAE
jgi:hypothetical protein